MTIPPLNEKAIFHAARQLGSAEARGAYLGQVCGEDGHLHARLEALLRVFEEDKTFLESAADVFPAARDDFLGEAPGTVIGPYKLLEQIGEGGFGVVFLAEQQHPIRRRVALKVIKPGMDTRQVIARFEAERQALAMMDHANIARVFDAGTTNSGRPYFVMELARGIPITDYCDRNQLPLPQRLELFGHTCQAIQHAHQKAIIHRDIKPSNVLVAQHDGAPVVKVIDFGIAKAMGQKLTEKTLSTNFAHMVGTPLYMSPEQADLSGQDIDTRTDIYALGVLLYELVTGTTPFDRYRLHSVPFDELRRIIREEEPPTPSTTLSRARSAEPGTRNANRTARSERRALRWRELDWIVMKCLEKERTRRYETADGLARDIERYLRDEPVEACPARAGYRLRKFVRRNRGRVVAAGLLLLALLAGIAGTTWGMMRAERARQNAVLAQRAEAERADGERRAKEEGQKRLAQIERGTEILASAFRDLNPEAADKEGVSLRALLSRWMSDAAQQLEGETVGDPLLVARLQHVLGISLRELGYLEHAERVLVKACQTRERLLGADNLDTVATKHHLAVLYRERGKYALAETLYKEVLQFRTAQLGTDHPDTLATQHGLAVLYHSQGEYVPAQALYKQVLAARIAQLGAHHLDTLTTQSRLAALYRTQGKHALAQALYEEVLAVRTAKLGPDHLATVASKDNLAQLYCDQGKYALAQELSKDVLAVHTAKLGADHPDTLTSKLHWACLQRAQKNYALAERLTKEVLEIRTAKLAADHPSTLHAKHELARIYQDQGKYVLAEALYKELLQVRTAKLGANHPDTLCTKADLAGLYRSMNRLDRSIPLKDPFKSGRD